MKNIPFFFFFFREENKQMKQGNGASSKSQAHGASAPNPFSHQDACAGQLVLGRAGFTVGSSTHSRQLGEDEQERSAAYLPGAHPMPHRLRNRPLLPWTVNPTEPKDGHRPCGFSLLPELLTIRHIHSGAYIFGKTKIDMTQAPQVLGLHC